MPMKTWSPLIFFMPVPKVVYQVRGVDFTYQGKLPLEVLRDFSWTMEAGENWAFLGPSGCGKSTLLNLLAGLLQPDQGDIRFFGQALQAADKRIGVVLQSYGLFPWKTVAQNVDLPLKLAGIPRPQRRLIVQNRLRELGLEAYGGAFPRALSGGQGQRVAIARALIRNPSVLLMDEPFSALDTLNRERLQEEVLSLTRNHQVQFVLVTHHIEEAVYLADKILIFGDLATPPHLLPNPAARCHDRTNPAFVAMAGHLRGLLRKEEGFV